MKKLILFLLPLSCAYSVATLQLSPIQTFLPTSGIVLFEPTSVATNDNGQAIVVWLKRIDILLSPQSVNPINIQSSVFQNGIWTSINDISLNKPLNSPSVAMDGLGNAVVDWTNLTAGQISIQASTLAINTTTWVTPYATLSINPVNDLPQVVTTPGGFTIATWADDTLQAIESATLDVFSLNSWLPADAVSTTATLPHQLYLDPFGTPFEAFTFIPAIPPPNTQMAVARKNPTWATFPFFTSNTNDTTEGHLGFDRLGGSIAVWQEFDSISLNYFLKFSTLPPGGITWSAEQLLQPTDVGPIAPAPKIGVDANGNAVAVWLQADGGITRAFASTLASGSSSWTTAVAISTAGLDLGSRSPQIGVDSNGNAVAVWNGTSDGGTTFMNQLGFLPFGTTTWQVQTIDSPPSSQITMPQIAVSPNGHVAISLLTSNLDFTRYAQALLGVIVSPSNAPNPPASISGVRRENRFLLQSEFFDVVRWEPSTSPGVVAFRIYRNGVLIAEVGANVFSFNDQRRREHERDVYGVSAVNDAGQESVQTQVVVQ